MDTSTVMGSEFNWVDGVLAFGTILLAIATFFLVRKTSMLAIITKQAAINDIRPYISFKEITTGPFLMLIPPSITTWAIGVVWQNTGRSLTHNMHENFKIEVVGVGREHPPEFSPNSPYTVKNLPVMSVAPG